MPGARVEEGCGTGVSPYRGPVGEPEKGGLCLLGILRIS